MNKNIECNSSEAWLLASRPKTLACAVVPIMIGSSTACAMTGGVAQLQIIPLLLCMLFAFTMQIDANFVNDYFDCVRGNDDETRLGPRRACSQGWISLPAMRAAILVTTLTACLIGLPLIYYGGWSMILIGVLCVLFCFLYTTKLSYLGMGDLLVLVFFGLVPVVLTNWLVTPESMRRITAELVVASVSCGLVIDLLLVVNNYRDIDNDRRAGKRTLVVAIGSRMSLVLYLLLGISACLSGLVFLCGGHLFAFLLPLLFLVFHIRTYRRMRAIRQGKALNYILAETSRNIFIYGLLLSIGFIV